jgi:polyhydroxybutyrate depolymerase
MDLHDTLLAAKMLLWLQISAMVNSGMAATVDKTVSVDGATRQYRIFVPGKPRVPAPVVIVLHGGGGNPKQMERYTDFDTVAEKHGFIVVYPQAISAHWNDGRAAAAFRSHKDNVDDVKFVRAMIDDVAKEQTVDRGRVFSTGISNGGIMSHRLAAEASDLIAGIAPVAGGIAPAIAETFHPKFPVSILIIQGDADPLVPIAGGDIAVFGGTPNRGKVIATTEALSKYVAQNGNPGPPTETTLESGVDDGTLVHVTKYADGPGGVRTEYIRVHNGGHTWPGRPTYAAESRIGKASQKFSASEAIWSFFQSCPPRTPAK